MFGGYMRGIEMFIEEINTNNNFYKERYTQIIYRLQDKYFKIFKFPEHFIYHYLLNIPVKYDDIVQNQTIQKWEENGNVVLKLIDKMHFISIPYFIMEIYCQQKKV
jgi:hypothetical protein